MSLERPAKRIRQACEPCRRKKSRCPGEKPVCSHCARLHQNCYYADERPENERASITPSPQVAQHRPASSVAGDGRIEDRLQFLENQLSEVLANQASMSRSTSVQVSDSPRRVIPPSLPNSGSSEKNLPSWDVIQRAAEIYLQYCDCQPLPLFQRSSFIRTLRNRKPEVLLSILAVALRFSEDRQSRTNHARVANGYVEACRTIISKQVFEGNVELSTIQALCLLTIVDFTDGHTRRASIHCSLAMSLAHNAGLTSESHAILPDQEKEERRRCFWSLFLVKRLHGADFMILDFSAEDNFPWYPETTGEPVSPGHEPSPARTDEQGPNKGIVAYAIQLSEVWFKITRYARRRGKPNSLPPWSSQSEYSTILAHQMDFETRMPYMHRFEPAKFSQRSVEHLNSNRDYWGPWLFIQFLYHTNLCLLNHPLLLSLRLRNFKCVIPEIFLQHTSDLISSHASWIINFIDMLEAKLFKVTDPFLGHCVAIIATIYLQESFVEDPGTRREKHDNFDKCLKFIRGFGEQWPHLGRIANKLQRLAETVSSTYVASEEPTRQNRKLLIDLGQFFEVLEYSSSSEVHGSARQLFGSSLHTSFSGSRTEMAQTSVLPQPTRVERQEFGNLTPNMTHVIDPLDSSITANVPVSVASVPLTYSDDELAVLAESFFHQRNEFDGNANWWNSMSMDAT
ncbi:fungal-specific transcription factor domain-containing protein [Leptodontidium sp. MPI-SDFR-AT-0119]|nr:fungal-specific transcription factor domain-containing protein [Leptodontidium sp. MPI-SDFR-AT-0119]